MIPDSGFIIHARGQANWFEDVSNRIPTLCENVQTFLNANPGSSIEDINRFLLAHEIVYPPYIGETPNHHSVNGIFAVIPLHGQQILELCSQGLRQKFYQRIEQAIGHLYQQGIRYIGPGALTGSALFYFAQRLPVLDGVVLSSGNTYTAVMAEKLISQVQEEFSIDPLKIAIVGAGGLTGNLVFQTLRGNDRISEIVAVDFTASLKRCDNSWETKVRLSNRIEDIKGCDIVVVFTSAPEYRIKSEQLDSGTILIDCTTPRNTQPEIATRDSLIIDGDLVLAPDIDHFDYGTPPRTVFACHAEIIILAAEKVAFASHKDNPFVGWTPKEVMPDLAQWGREIGLDGLPPHHSFGLPIPKQRLEEFKEIRRTKNA